MLSLFLCLAESSHISANTARRPAVIHCIADTAAMRAPIVQKCNSNHSCDELRECGLYWALNASHTLSYWEDQIVLSDLPCFILNCERLCEDGDFEEKCDLGVSYMADFIAEKFPSVSERIRLCNLDTDPCDTMAARVCTESAKSDLPAAAPLKEYCSAVCAGSQQKWCPKIPEDTTNWGLIGGAVAAGVLLLVLVIVGVVCWRKRATRHDDWMKD
jgi:hypothetical protein